MPRYLWFSRLPSSSNLSTFSKVSKERVQRDYGRKFRRHWKEILVSFILVASIVTLIVVVMGLKVNLPSARKAYKASRQRGPLVLPKTTTLEHGENEDETTVNTEMPTIGEEAENSGLDDGAEERPHPMHPDIEDIEELKYEGKKLRAPRVMLSGDNGAKCSTPLCRSLTLWFQKTVGRQADPCKERNMFVCDPTVPFPGFQRPLAKPQRMASSRPAKAQGTVTRLRGGPHEAESADLLKSCLEYAREPNASVDDILMFLFQLNLDLRRMVDDPAEDPLARMMELSLEYGVETPVSFVRQYDVTGDASAPYVIKITVNRELKDFFNSFRSLEEAEILTFYQLCIRRYAQLEDNLLAEQLVNADDELSDFLNKTEASIQPSRIDISKLAEATGVTEGRWKQLLGSFGRSSGAVHKEVIADEQALSVVAYMSRPLERLAMRRHLSWHVLRYMVGPQADITMAANQTDDQVDPRHYNSFRPRHPEVKCRDMLGKLRGVPYAALSFWEGNDIVPTAAIVNVTRFMGEFQAAMGSVFRGTAVDRSKTAEKENVMASGPALSRASQVPLFPNTAGRDVDSVSLFAALDGGNESIWEDPGASTHRFPFRWVRHLRAWYALPPLLQALLPRMASVAHVDKPEAFFRPPYYDATAPPEYNFATLGQVVSQVMAHQLVERRHVDPAVGKRWRGFWDGVRAFDNNSVYCMRTGIAKNGTWREKRLDDNKITNKERLVGVLGSRIAYLAFLRAQRLNASWTSLAERLPGVHLSSQQIFFIMHCAVSCVIGRGGDAVQRPANEHCVVAYRSGKRSVNRPCRQAATGRVPNECNYI